LVQIAVGVTSRANRNFHHATASLPKEFVGIVDRSAVATWNVANIVGAIKDSDNLLSAAETSGMEVSQAGLDEDRARDALTRARVTIHSFRKELVDQDIQDGLKLAGKTLQAGKNALAERDYRRRGLGLAVDIHLADRGRAVLVYSAV
jgi:hypothetical protein